MSHRLHGSLATSEHFLYVVVELGVYSRFDDVPLSIRLSFRLVSESFS